MLVKRRGLHDVVLNAWTPMYKGVWGAGLLPGGRLEANPLLVSVIA